MWVEVERMPQQLYLQFEELEGRNGFDCVGHGEFVVIMIRGSFLHVRTLKVVAAAAAMDEVASCMVLLMSLDSVHWSPDFWTSLPPSHFSISVVN
jgi:hypothetical protein